MNFVILENFDCVMRLIQEKFGLRRILDISHIKIFVYLIERMKWTCTFELEFQNLLKWKLNCWKLKHTVISPFRKLNVSHWHCHWNCVVFSVQSSYFMDVINLACLDFIMCNMDAASYTVARNVLAGIWVVEHLIRLIWNPMHIDRNE